MSRDGAGSSSNVRRLLGMPPSLSRDVAARMERIQQAAAVNNDASMDTECSGDESDGAEPDEAAGKGTAAEEQKTTVKRPQKRRKRRIRLTDQGLKAKRKAERREKMLAEKKVEVQDDEELEEAQMETAASPSPPKEEEVAKEKEQISPETFTPFQLFCDNILRKLTAKDPEGYFESPVTDSEAPNYHSIIECPMDFATMRGKIEQNVYANFEEFKRDAMLISDNAMLYNSSSSAYHLAAQKLALLAKYYLSEKYLTYLYYTLPFAKSVPPEQLGIRSLRNERAKPKHLAKNEDARRRALDSIKDNMKSEEITKTALREIKDRLTGRKPCHIGYLDNRDGALALNVLTPTSADEPARLTLGDSVLSLSKGNPGICTPFEPRICQDYLISYTNPGPYASFAPQYDTTWATLSKRDSDLLLSCYGDKDNVADAVALRQMVANAGSLASGMVESMLNELTDNEHSKTMALLENKESETIVDGVIDEATTSSINKTGKMIEELASMQHQRLSKAPPATLSEATRPGSDETQLADRIVQGLSQQVAELGARPADLVSSHSVHHALGLDADDYDVLSEFLEV